MHGSHHRLSAHIFAREAIVAAAGHPRAAFPASRSTYSLHRDAVAAGAGPVRTIVAASPSPSSTSSTIHTAPTTTSSSSSAVLARLAEHGAVNAMRLCGQYATLLATFCGGGGNGSRDFPTSAALTAHLRCSHSHSCYHACTPAMAAFHARLCTLSPAAAATPRPVGIRRLVTAATAGATCSGSSGGGVAVAAAATAAWFYQCRHASSGGRRPTHSEISESLAVFGYGNINYEDKELKKKYRELVKTNHPDAGGDEHTMARIAVAYERLSCLTRREKEEFRAHQSAFSGRMRAGSYSNPYQDHRYAHQNPARRGGFPQQTPGGFGGQYYQQDSPSGAGGSQESAYWNYYHRMHHQQQAANGQGGSGGGFGENPFTSRSPFSFYAQTQRMRFASASSLLVQGLALYLVLSVMFLFMYRAVRDYLHEDGWRMSDSLARHEQMQELHRLRQEMHERASQQRDTQQQQRSGADPGHAFLYDARPAGSQLNPHLRETPEQRALEYARQRRVQIIEEQRRLSAAQGGLGALQEVSSNLLNTEVNLSHLPEMKGWPRISRQEGRIIKRAQDPPGVVFFEPCQVDARARQIYSRMREADRSAPCNGPSKVQSSVAGAADAAATPSTLVPSVGSARNGTDPVDRDERPAGVPVTRTPADSPKDPWQAGTGVASAPHMLESNVASVFAAQVNNNADAREAMKTIFGAIREARERNSA